mgnify:CR=1 FL=1
MWPRLTRALRNDLAAGLRRILPMSLWLAHGGLFLRAAADTQMLSEASTEAMQNGAKLAPFCFCLLPSSISKYSTTYDISLTESSRYIRKIKWLL